MGVSSVEASAIPVSAGRRLINDAIRDGARRLHRSETVFQFMCECGDPACNRFVWLSLRDYDLSLPGSVLVEHVP